MTLPQNQPPAQVAVSNPAPVSDREWRQGVIFCLRLARALHQYGAPAHRLEEMLRELSRVLGLGGSFFSAPTAIFSSFERGDGEETHLQRIESSEVDLGKLSDLDALARQVLQGRKSPAEGVEEVPRIVAKAPRYRAGTTLAAFGLASASASRFFGGGLAEIGLSLVAGLGIGLISLAVRRWAILGRLYEPLGGLAVSLIAVLGSAWVAPASVSVVTLAGLIVLLPGLMLTLAVSELALKSLVSGTSRLISAVMVFLMLGFGVVLGTQLGVGLVGPTVEIVPQALPAWTEGLAVVVAGLTFTILFQARPRDLFWIVLAGVGTFSAVRAGSAAFGVEVGTFLGAIALGAGSNLYGRLLQRPAMVTRVPGLMLLVPGSLGFLSVSSLLAEDALEGVQTAFRVGLFAVALVTGLLFASVLVPPRRQL